MKVFMFGLGAMALLLPACQNEVEQWENPALNDANGIPMSVEVVANTATKAIGVEEDYLPNSAKIGVLVVDNDHNTTDGTYDNKTYENIYYQATGISTEQTWAIESGKSILLSATRGTAYAYYPFNAAVTDFTQIPIDINGEDYMFATAAGNVSNANYRVPFTMDHALSQIKLNIKNVNYTGSGKITSIKVESEGFGISGTMNALNKSVASTAAPYTYEPASDLVLGSGQTIETFLIPTGNADKTVTFTIEMDGQTYSATSSTVTFASGWLYTFNVSISARGMSVSQVSVNEWSAVTPSDDIPADLETVTVSTVLGDVGGTISIWVNGTQVASAGAYGTLTYSYISGDAIELKWDFIYAENADSYIFELNGVSQTPTRQEGGTLYFSLPSTETSYTLTLGMGNPSVV